MLHVLGCITEHHDFRLLAIALPLCAFSCWTAITLLSRMGAGEDRMRKHWIAGAAFVFGAGTWATHFVAMLAFRSPFLVSYDLGLTFFSIAIAIGFSAMGFSMTFLPRYAVSGGIILGLGISAMHYVGMLALQGSFHIIWAAPYVLASVSIGAVFGTSASLACARLGMLRYQLVAAAALTVGVCAMHFTGMSAVMMVPDPRVSSQGAAMDPGGLALAVTAIAVLIVALGQISAQLDRHLAIRRSAEVSRQQKYISELEGTRQKLNQAMYETQKAHQAKSAFLATMSHELRTPLNAIIGFAEMMKTETLGPVGIPRYAEYVGDIFASGSHLLALINDILDLSRLDAGKCELVEEDFSLAATIDDICRALQSQAHRAGLTLVTEYGSELPLLHADERRTKQIALNLISNAIKFTPENGRVTVSAAIRDRAICLTVQDTGIGMSHAELQKALEPFGQVDSHLARKHEGSGLGLPLTRQLVELHGAEFGVRTEPGKGTLVTVIFPSSRTGGPAPARQVLAPLAPVEWPRRSGWTYAGEPGREAFPRGDEFFQNSLVR